MLQEIIAYKKVATQLDELIDKSPYKKKYIIEQLGLSSPTYYRKLQTQSFTIGEMLVIAKILDPVEYNKWELLEEIEQAKEEIRTGKTIPHSEMVKRIKAKKKDNLE
ncbi:hypothetical protein HYN56_18320 [Flavobacterium crocinum]|uniref:HTH cro/C1-type domain-containing protein n=1 Tax=Flavobacterium crocinum TaxID=2183896 RepID=A0A2S1YPS0_9FLAO|nr:hypothetical protein [Flavobacterium crocinum]AWK06075.1 hypothetical protein HYN56_18320 [Flavobacterium crocinum]